MTRLILLDRDGVINFDSSDHIKHPSEWRAIPGSLEAIAALRARGFKVAVCTNQAGIARGTFSKAELAQIHAKMDAALKTLNTRLDGLIYCPHRPEQFCDCRKPKPGMLLEMMARLAIDAEHTIFIGDSLRDLQAAIAAGCRGVLVRTGNGADTEAVARAEGLDFGVVNDLAAFVGELAE